MEVIKFLGAQIRDLFKEHTTWCVFLVVTVAVGISGDSALFASLMGFFILFWVVEKFYLQKKLQNEQSKQLVKNKEIVANFPKGEPPILLLRLSDNQFLVYDHQMSQLDSLANPAKLNSFLEGMKNYGYRSYRFTYEDRGICFVILMHNVQKTVINKDKPEPKEPTDSFDC